MGFKKQLSISLLAIGVTLGGVSACSSTTDTGAIGVNRKQMLMVSSDEVLNISNQSYLKTLQEARKDGVLDTNPAQLQRLKTIANRLIAQTKYIALTPKTGNGKCILLKATKSMPM